MGEVERVGGSQSNVDILEGVNLGSCSHSWHPTYELKMGGIL